MLRFAIAVFIAFVFAACSPPAEHTFVSQVPENGWPAGHRLTGEFNVSDTITPFNFFITLRNTNDYPYSNLYLFVHTIFPNNKRSKDTINCILTDRAGRWLGSGNGFIVDQKVIANKVLYNYQKKFPLSGKYRFEIEHAMRPDTIYEIIDAGVRIEKSK